MLKMLNALKIPKVIRITTIAIANPARNANAANSMIDVALVVKKSVNL